jgi:hypothetical protein
MPLGSLAGHARVSTTDPRAQAQCDRCREIYNIDQLSWQYQWAGAGLINTGLLVCRRKCLDIPFEQYRVLILPGDPIPVPNARPAPEFTPPAFNPQQPEGYSVNTYIPLPTDPYNQGFTPYQVGGVSPAATPWTAAQGTPQIGGFPPGFPATKAGVLAAAASASGIPTPAQVVDYSTTIASPSATQPWLTAQPNRTWLLMFSPAGPMSGFSKAQALLGSTTTLMFGPGMAWFWANTQGLGNVYTGAITVAGLTAGMPVWAWQSAYPNVIKLDGYGNPLLDGYGNWELL